MISFVISEISMVGERKDLKSLYKIIKLNEVNAYCIRKMCVVISATQVPCMALERLYMLTFLYLLFQAPLLHRAQ